MPLRGKRLTAGVTAACGLGFLLFGYDQGVMGGVIGSSTFVKQFNHPDALTQGLITGLYDLGCLIGSIAAFFFSEPIGRKKSIWQSEVSSAQHRGQLVTIEAALIICGLAMSNWVCFGASYIASSFQWRGPIAVQCIFALYLLITVPFLVESPRWLANHKSIAEATKVIAQLKDLPEDDPEVTSITREIEVALEEESSADAWHKIFTNGGEQNFRRMMLGVGGLYMQQMCGINSIGYYLPVILEQYIGLSNSLSLILSAVAATQFFVISFAPVWFIEKAGRRNCMIWGAVAQAIIMALLCVGFALDTKPALAMMVAMFFLFDDAFALSFLNVPWMYAPEINSLKMRTKGGAAAAASNWLFNGIVVTVTPIGLDKLRWKYYLIFVVLNISFIPLVYFCYPETKGITLEQIDRIFVGKGTGLGALTQGVKESLHLKRDIDQHELNSDEESGIKDDGDNDAHGEHIEIAKA
ncbi:hypothetical protein PENARI_c019G08736 [Penicillium arizonense]|uniref:Major facilitator superfamily (MFS) profile domain-containing protein n=1 Tax=Penicillium arizonense TaxID=1835702 RepID=A0A1F5L9S3_PENAI|nr:hypothetical protein PENARI_c019G08736 [Penicillium arizonense]OGE49952.1 hypothetical protein PENARI_c019G08736 [Penicillium arizonense]